MLLLSVSPKLKIALRLLDRLKRKYGKTVADVIAFGEDVGRKLAEVEDRDEIPQSAAQCAR